MKFLKQDPTRVFKHTNVVTALRPIRFVNGGPEAWGILHLKALSNSLTLEWLENDFKPMIPHRVKCDCAAGYDSIVEEIPFRVNDQFVWSVDVHNAVNRKTGKPEMTLDEAKSIWVNLTVPQGI